MRKTFDSAQPVVQVDALRSGMGATIIHDGVSFEVKRGEIFVILGGSGSGKSVLMRHLIGLHEPLSGRIFIHGRELSTASAAERAEILRSIGVMFQLGALFGSMTLLENVSLPLEVHTGMRPQAIELVARMKLALVGLSGFEDYKPAQISGGMVKRAAIARALALDPAVVLLDEPSAGLDPITSAGIDRLILRLRDTLGITFIVITHELESIYAIADRAIMLDKESKGIVAEGKPQELRDHTDNPKVRQFFNRQADEEGISAT
ncbi:MAG TPA: ATP-binding cassette domain-containing protein [Burkholderiales bacterium]|nr:ATP-binding cassette domain-containing protein [Burkholderiales bacterium]